ncbi:MAG: hypothetical protein KGM47_07285, partial [Acidobacteriota bacterium]|nr:hypothetical protein [Acidobacteriota bacterium]
MRCHATLRFLCPACQHGQDHGGKCEQCGADFAKVAVAMALQAEIVEKGRRAQIGRRNEIVKQALLLP